MAETGTTGGLRTGLDLVEEEVAVGGLTLSLSRPRDLDALVDEETFRHDEFVPYWAELWPSGRDLAEALPPSLGGVRVLELGCGLGLPSMVAAARGAMVTAVDWSPDAVAVLRHNAAANGLDLAAELVSWTNRPWFATRGPWDLVLAADVLYERRHLQPLLGLLPTLADRVLVADPGRPALGDFLEAAGEEWAIEDLTASVLALERLEWAG